MHRQLFQTLAADMTIAPWVAREINLSCEGRRGAGGELRMGSKSIIGHWREKGPSFHLQLVKDSREKDNKLQTLLDLAAVYGLPLPPRSFQNLSTCQVPEFLPRKCLPVISPLGDLIIDSAN